MDPKQKLLRTVLNLERYRSLNLQLIEIRLLGQQPMPYLMMTTTIKVLLFLMVNYYRGETFV
ncbi:hypothetical protein IMAU80824_01644 [Lactiplantibacillus plantarum]|nr:hypothetical protein [Lactiplantibacillus plantarum]